jgi:hypothetical protein
MRFYLIFPFVCALITQESKAQTSIVPHIIYDAQKVEFTDALDKSTATNGSIGLGLGFEQGLMRGFGLAYELDITKKNIAADVNDIANTYGFKFNQFRNTLHMKYYALKKLHLGVGVSHSIWLKTRETPQRPFYVKPNSGHLSICSSARLKLQPITIDFYITKWLAVDSLYSYVHDSMSFGLKIGYPITFFKKLESSKVRCPNF